MLEMSDTAIGQFKIPPVSPFVHAREILADALPLLQPSSKISVTDAAEMFVRVPVAGDWQKFDRTVAPYLTEPADMTRSRLYNSVVFVGPAQSGKTTLLSIVGLYPVACDPDPVRIVHMDRRSADQWVEEKLDPMISSSPEIRARLGRSREDSTFSRKRFRGMRITIGYPVASFLSSTSQRYVLLTDYDHMPQVLGPKDSPEGSPYGMALARITTYMSRGCVMLESTPAFPITDANWRASPLNPHEMPPVSGGIVRIYNQGTRGRWYWECMDCTQLFEPAFDRLKYDPALDPGEAGASAEMACPHCGGLVKHRHKVELNRRALAGRGGWLHEGSSVGLDGRRELCRIGDAGVRQTNVASYALNGAAAAFSSWSNLVSEYETARRQMELFGDETELSRVYYTLRGEPYLPKSLSDEDGLSVSVLRDHVVHVERAAAPDWVRAVTVTADVQSNRFPVLVTGWGENGARVILDRFDLAAPPEHAPRAAEREVVAPGKYAEDWDVLTALSDRVYPVAGSGWGLKPSALVVDFQGEAGVSDNAEKFWRARKRAGQAAQWFVSRGLGGYKWKARVWHEAPERGSNGKKARSIKILNMATDRLKDSVMASVGRLEGGPGAYLVPAWVESDHLNELLSERRTPSGWEKRPGQARNETLDLSVQALAVMEHRGLNSLNPENLPDWMALGARNPFAVALQTEGAPQPVIETAAPEGAAPVGIRWLKRR